VIFTFWRRTDLSRTKNPRSELAAEAIERIIDPAAPPEERAQRRRRLTKGPLEFREERVDRAEGEGEMSEDDPNDASAGFQQPRIDTTFARL
jgi:hypothetical protein